MISKRIKTIADMIDISESVVDVGCDHGYLAVCLKNKGHQGKILCVDNKEGPLNKAKENIDKYQLDNTDTLLSNGLENVKDIMDVVVIAGIGCKTMIQIISSNIEYFESNRLILQSNDNVDLLREWLNKSGFKIDDETILKDYKYYEILQVSKGKQNLTALELEFGPFLLKEKSPVFVECYKQKRDKLIRILENLPSKHPDRFELEQNIKKIETII